MTRPPAHPARVAGLLCALALSAACAGCSGASQAPATGLTPLGDANPAMKTERPEAPAGLAVTDVRTGHHDTFDRVVFDLAGEGRPGWYVDYDETPASQASGATVTYRGSVALNVNIDGTAYPFEVGVDDPHLTRVTAQEDGVLTEVVPVGTLEGRSQFVVGLEREVPYSVQVIDGPTRLVIDLVRG
ncbi:hypothetical protein CFRA_02515 [Corynebacterium frankenforstense DSM 45800]|uniref:AMIN-like domain-containing protein n=1 Tax=Corynebacterium frankenforstense DSM 45800 TaxID=1437875 RepID=A0A1L7CR73_9CORY|nr:hypothetical protein [Corynebacterium frankenforstense]APT88332.1 hypothetical protein CFRA_02515 [Corynebacterium frankenforstense DSM 45800]